MKTDHKTSRDIDTYIAQFPAQVRRILEQVRSTIRQAAPDAQEKISYAMPTFTLNGNLVHFAAYKNHLGLYPGPGAIERFRDELAEYETSKGAIRFPLDLPIPYQLIESIVKDRVEENLQAAGTRQKKKTKSV